MPFAIKSGLLVCWFDCTNQLAPARFNAFFPVGLIAQKDAGHFVIIRLYFHVAGVGEDQLAAHLQVLHFQIGHRVKSC